MTATNIRSMIDTQIVTTHLQPIVSVKKRAILGVEALSRGQDGPYRLFSPTQLFGWAEEAKLLDELDVLCLRSSLQEYRKLQPKPEGLLLFLNLHAGRLSTAQLSAMAVRRAVEEAGMRSQDVVLELSDRQGNVPGLRSFIETCRSLGFTLAYDDVDGSGEGLRRLQSLHPDLVKIDDSLVRGISADMVKQEQFRAVAALARRMGVLTVAEGVENEEDASQCLELGADLLQGFHFGRPVGNGNYPFPGIQSAVDRSAGRLKATLSGQAHGRSRENAKHLQLMDRMLASMSGLEPQGFDQALLGFVNEVASVECLYAMNKVGTQVTRTVVWQHQRDNTRSLLFAPAAAGADHSLKDYYLGLTLEDQTRFMSEPYVSMATGSLCRTVTARFKALDGSEYILCMDIKTQ
jgi:EAL domain-containing protein (putative c-di-GMP-specific phosphodiesterase class I)